MKKYFIAGLILILPLAITLLIVSFLVNVLTAPFLAVVGSILVYYNLIAEESTQFILHLSKILILTFLIGFTFMLGLLGEWFFENYMIGFTNLIFHRIPLVNKVYKACQELVNTLFTPKSTSFKQVVMVPFPSENSRSLGLISRERMPEGTSPEIQHLVTVLLPGTPNPTMGFVLLYNPEKIEPLTLKPEEALKCIVSCGILLNEFGLLKILDKPDNL